MSRERACAYLVSFIPNDWRLYNVLLSILNILYNVVKNGPTKENIKSRTRTD